MDDKQVSGRVRRRAVRAVAAPTFSSAVDTSPALETTESPLAVKETVQSTAETIKNSANAKKTRGNSKKNGAAKNGTKSVTEKKVAAKAGEKKGKKPRKTAGGSAHSVKRKKQLAQAGSEQEATAVAPEDGNTESALAAPNRAPAAALLFQAPIAPPRPEPGPADDSSDEDDQDETAGDTADEDSPLEGDDADTPENGEDGDEDVVAGPRRRTRRRGGRGRGRTRRTTEDDDNGTNDDEAVGSAEGAAEDAPAAEGTAVPVSRRRRRTRPRSVTTVRESAASTAGDEVTALKGSTRLEAKRQRRRDGRRDGRRRHLVTEAEFLSRRESVKRDMIVRERDGLNQIAVLEDGLLVEHFVARRTQSTMVGNVYLGRVQNVLPSMEAAFIDLGKGRNAVLYAGEVNWDAVGLEGQPRRIEQALKSGDQVLVQVTKDPIGHKGARLTSQITLAGRYLVLVPSGAMTGISRKLPERERQRLKQILREILPADAGVIVRTAAEGATEDQLRDDIARLTHQWEDIQTKRKRARTAPLLLRGEPELAVRVVRDIFNEDFATLVVQGDEAWRTIRGYVADLSPDLLDRLQHWDEESDVFAANRIDEQLSKGMERKVWLPSGGSLVIDRTEAMSVVDVNTGRFTGSGGTLEETVTRNNLEAAEEIVRQLRLRDIGGIIVIDFVDMVLEANRDLVLRRLVECLGRDRTRHQVTEITSLGLVQMTRKRVGQGLVEAFSTPCECCEGRGFIVQDDPVERAGKNSDEGAETGRPRRRGHQDAEVRVAAIEESESTPERKEVASKLAAIAAATNTGGAEANAAEATSEESAAPQTVTIPGQAQEGDEVARQAAGNTDSKARQEPGAGDSDSDSGVSTTTQPTEPAEGAAATSEEPATEPAQTGGAATRSSRRSTRSTRSSRARGTNRDAVVVEPVTVDVRQELDKLAGDSESQGRRRRRPASQTELPEFEIKLGEGPAGPSKAGATSSEADSVAAGGSRARRRRRVATSGVVDTAQPTEN